MCLCLCVGMYVSARAYTEPEIMVGHWTISDYFRLLSQFTRAKCPDEIITKTVISVNVRLMSEQFWLTFVWTFYESNFRHGIYHVCECTSMKCVCIVHICDYTLLFVCLTCNTIKEQITIISLIVIPTSLVKNLGR